MKPWLQLSIFPAVIFSLETACCGGADTDAITFPPGINGVGFYNSGVGWSFVPKANLVVTGVGYRDGYSSLPEVVPGLQIAFWSSTNTPFASYLSDDFIDFERDTNHVVYSKVSPLLLTAGTQYFVTSDLGTNPQVVGIFCSISDMCNPLEIPPFVAASDLVYQGSYDYDVRSGSLRPAVHSPVLLLGPTFRFQLASMSAPRLSVESVGNAVVLTWPTNVQGCVVEISTSIALSNWEPATNASAPTIAGDRYSFSYCPPDSEPRFFRLRLPRAD